MPTLNWIGKDKVVNHHRDVPFKILEHQYGFSAENGKQTTSTDSGNKIIHGDNLEALKALLPEYEGKIKSIYIDPPYNTGEEKWRYNDNVNHPQIKKWIGEVVGGDELDLSRHDKWLCMMYPRLKLLHTLLDKDGVIFISIDDNENFRLRTICDEIFGLKQFVTCLVWEKKKKGTHLDKKRISIKEYIYVYCKNKNYFNGLIGEIKSEKETYPCINPGNKRSIRTIPSGTKSTYRDKNYFLEKGSQISAGNMYLELIDDLVLRNGKLESDVRIEAEWRYSQENLYQFAEKNELYFTRDLYLRREVSDIRYKKLKDLLFRVEYDSIDDLKNSLILELEKDSKDLNIIEELKEKISRLENIHHLDSNELYNLNNTGWGSNEDGDEELRLIFGKKVFDFPKPSKLVFKLLASTLFKEGYFLDSFAGSGTTGHAVLNLNKLDNGSRKFILIEMEDYADSITSERIQKVIKGFDKELENNLASFDYYNLGLPLFDELQNLNEDVPTFKIREYIWYSETRSAYEAPKSSTDNEYFLGTKDRTVYYFVYDKNALTTLDYDLLSTIKTKGEQYVVYADNCLLSKEFMAKNNIVFKKIPRDISRF